MIKNCLAIVAVGLLFLVSLQLATTTAHAQNTHLNDSGGTHSESISKAVHRIWSEFWSSSDKPAEASSTAASAVSTLVSSPASSPVSSPVSSQKVASSDTTLPQISGRYVAMGDSVAAGLGLPLVSGASSQDTRCGRSNQAYPYKVAQTKQLQLVHVACSGATAGDLVSRQGVKGPNISRQISHIFAGGQPTLITATAGANDVRWTRFIYKCYQSTCGTAADTAAVDNRLVLLQAKLLAFFGELQARSQKTNNSTPPTTVVTGYYNPVSAQCNVSASDGATSTSSRQPAAYLSAAELGWIETSVEALNQTIRQVASQFAFARYAAVDFTGHDICSSDPWVQSLTDPAPIHPTAEGQRVIAESILRNTP